MTLAGNWLLTLVIALLAEDILKVPGSAIRHLSPTGGRHRSKTIHAKVARTRNHKPVESKAGTIDLTLDDLRWFYLPKPQSPCPSAHSDGCYHLKWKKVPQDVFITTTWRVMGPGQDLVGLVCRNDEWGHV